MSDGDGYETAYVTQSARDRYAQKPRLREVLTVDQALAALQASARGESVPSIARRFSATHAAVREALQEASDRID